MGFQEDRHSWPILLLLFVCLNRYVVRLSLRPLKNIELENSNIDRVLIYGAGEAGSTLANSINQSKKQVLVGFLDDVESYRDAIYMDIWFFSNGKRTTGQR